MASYEEYLKKKLKQGKQPLSYEEWTKKVGVVAENADADIQVDPGPDGEEGTIDDIVTFVPSEHSESVEIIASEEIVEVEEPAPDLRSPVEKARDAHLAKFWAAKKGGAV